MAESSGKLREAVDWVIGRLKASTQSQTGDPAAVVEQIWQQWQEMAAKEPSPWQRALREANCCIASRDWGGAESAYLRAVEAAQEQPMLQAHAYGDLAAFYEMLGRPDDARAAAQSASEAARGSRSGALASGILQGEARLCLLAGDLDVANALIDEALALVEGNELADQPRATARLLRAECFLQARQLPQARLALAESRELLPPQGPPAAAAGAQHALARWWCAEARLRSAVGDRTGAVQAWREAVSRRRLVVAAPQVDGPYVWCGLAASLRDLGMALQAVGDPVAREALEESRAIRAALGLSPLDGTIDGQR